MRHYAGQVWFLPPEFEEGGDNKRRPHLLLTTREDDESGVFSYASTKSTEARLGASVVTVDPAASPDANTGFEKSTFIYPSRLVPVLPGDFGQLAGRLVHEMPRVRAGLRTALGLGSGTTAGFGAAAFSWRGRIVRFRPHIEESLGYAYGIVLTEANYSRKRRYQTIVPMDRLECFEPEDGDIILATLPWFSRVDPTMTAALIGIGDVQSIFHPKDIARWTGAVIDNGTLGEIEARLKELFEL